MFNHSAFACQSWRWPLEKENMMDNSLGQVKFICKAINHSSIVNRFHKADCKWKQHLPTFDH